MTIDDMFNTLRNGTDQEKDAMREFIRRPENMHLLSSRAFMQAAVANADLFCIPGMTPEETAAYDAAVDAVDAEAEETCPCCGQHISN